MHNYKYLKQIKDIKMNKKKKKNKKQTIFNFGTITGFE